MKIFAFLSSIGGGGTEITVVDNYNALLVLPPTADTFYWCQNSQGTSWLPGSLGGTYYPKGIYYCLTTSPLVIQYIETPYQATQVEVNAGTNTDKFITPKTFNDSSQLTSKANLSGATFTGSISATNLSGTNTGDETQSSILSKLGFFILKQSTPNSTVTGAGEIIIGSVPIGSNRLATIDKLIVDSTFVKTTTLGTYTLKYYLAPNSNNLTGAVEIARATGFAATAVFIPTFPRNYDVESGNLKGFPFTQSAVIPTGTSNPMSTTPFNVANTFHFITTVQFTNTSDSGYLNSQLIKNF